MLIRSSGKPIVYYTPTGAPVILFFICHPRGSGDPEDKTKNENTIIIQKTKPKTKSITEHL
jgi:hypothetical protein